MSYQNWGRGQIPQNRHFEQNNRNYNFNHGSIHKQVPVTVNNFDLRPSNNHEGPLVGNNYMYSNFHPAYRNDPYNHNMSHQAPYNANLNMGSFHSSPHRWPGSPRVNFKNQPRHNYNHEQWKKPGYGPLKRNQREHISYYSSKNQTTNMHKYFKESMLEDPWKDLIKDKLSNDISEK